MSDETKRNHPDIETLANFLGGQLSQNDTATTRDHLDECFACRLEVKRLARFEEIDSDADLEREADWKSARINLERAFRENVLPEVAERKPARETKRAAGFDFGSFWTRWQIRWLAPVAAAAAVLIVVIQVQRINPPGTAPDDLGPMRGTPAASADIVAAEPAGDIPEAPKVFRWQSKWEDDYYTIEIFRPDLSKIFEVEGITDLRWSVSDSLKSILKPDSIYLWTVTGHRGVERETVSPNAWFKITPKVD
jgi:hypothetical protein